MSEKWSDEKLNFIRLRNYNLQFDDNHLFKLDRGIFQL